MAVKEQVVEVRIEYLVTWYGDEGYDAHPTTKAGEVSPIQQAIEIAIDDEGAWEDG